MGPRRWCRGKDARQQAHSSGSYRASMGPRRWCRGKRPRSMSIRPDLRRLQWGRDDGVAEKARTCADADSGTSCFNGAATIVSRKSRESPALQARSRTASMGPRRSCRGKYVVRRDGADDADLASMGPRRWCRGKCAFVCVQREPGDRFNGAATMVSRKGGAVLAADIEASRWLQWGRDDRVAEKDREGTQRADSEQASMGPRRSCRGKMPAMVAAEPATVLLQWGRDDRVAERSQRGHDLPRHLACFNGAATIVSRKGSGDRCGSS